ncbi:MAG: hypothetical protein DRO14_05280 [Thermoprotei archaeon]|nr:MAG: hypothetical protein DRO14_05280 [Thermoprotei archaeon]
MGKVREVGEIHHYVCEDALDDDGYVLTTLGAATAGNLKKATSSNYYKLIGVNFKSTEDPFNPGTYLSNQRIPVIVDGVVRVQITDASNRSTDIAVGDLVAVYDGGKVAHWEDCPIHTLLGTVNAANLERMLTSIVGQALEAVAADEDPDDGKILVKLSMH